MVKQYKKTSNKDEGSQISEGSRGLTTLLLDENKSRGSFLRRSLEEFGYEVVQQVATRQELYDAALKFKPQVLVIGIDIPDSDIFSQVAKINHDCPLPIVMFAEKGAPKLIRQAVHAGISAFVVDDIQPQRFNSIITVAIERFRVSQALINELNETKLKLTERKTIDQAKAYLIKEQGLTEDQAHVKLRRMSMDKGVPLIKIAQNIVDVFEMINK